MKIISIYEAVDGARFEKADDCMAHEHWLQLAKAIRASLWGEAIMENSSKFRNGRTFIQHTKDAFEKYRSEVSDYIKSRYPADHESFCHRGDGLGAFGRMIDDSKDNVTNKLLSVLNRTDSQYREWGQLYYRNNPPTDASAITREKY
jgi:hypothetical protein